MEQLNVNYIKRLVCPLDFYRYELPGIRITKPTWNDAGLCPFHADSKHGSFFVDIQTGAFKCFSCGAAGGDVIAFTRKMHGLEFVDALERLASDWGV